MTKIVINVCFGGFGLSKKAWLELYRRKSKLVKAMTPKEYYGGIEGWEEQFERYKKTEFGHQVVAPDGKIIYDNIHDKDRADPDLVDIVEKMGKKANGWAADLKVVEIPDGVKWEIDDYDGSETIAEVHRTWS